MNILTAAQLYINEIVQLAGPGLKIILMDKETTSIVSCTYSQSEMMQKEVYLFDRIDATTQGDALKYVKAVVFLRPTTKNIQLLCEEVKNPKYSQYYVNFSNLISKAEVKKLAEADNKELIKDLNEFYLDYIPLSTNLASLGIKDCYEEGSFELSSDCLARSVQMLTALSLSFKRKPSVRYLKASSNAVKLAEAMDRLFIRDDQLFESCSEEVLILILDRSEDAVTPLLNQWTYEAMVNELVGITNNRVKLNMLTTDQKGHEKREDKNYVLNCLQDEFYAENMYLNFGEIGQNIKKLMSDFQIKAKTHQELESVSDMKKFIEDYPQFKKISGTVSMHVQLVGELSAIVAKEKLMEVSELEQMMAANGDHSTCLGNTKRLIQDRDVNENNCLRLAMLYALRFEEHLNNSLPTLLSLLRSRQIAESKISAVRNIISFGGIKSRQNDLFKNQSASEMAKRFIKGFKGVENIYTQHEPYIIHVLESLVRNRLSESAFPHVRDSNGGSSLRRVESVILHVIGGATYEESAAVNAFNLKSRQNPSYPNVVLSSNWVHTTGSFVEALSKGKH
uniref:Vacuolar protein sorting-associated protein 45 n=1 Tax=Rhabditophanes sp. KR3021 TaxID=114890 RepID=A0AC35TQV1_9BILA